MGEMGATERLQRRSQAVEQKHQTNPALKDIFVSSFLFALISSPLIDLKHL